MGDNGATLTIPQCVSYVLDRLGHMKHHQVQVPRHHYSRPVGGHLSVRHVLPGGEKARVANTKGLLCLPFFWYKYVIYDKWCAWISIEFIEFLLITILHHWVLSSAAPPCPTQVLWLMKLCLGSQDPNLQTQPKWPTKIARNGHR